MKKNRSRGFTLIELLVVIAIIGVLSAVVLASLNTARSKGNDAAIKSNLATISTQAELYYDSNSNSYGTASACTTAGTFVAEATIAQAISQIDSANGSGGLVTCGSSGSAYMVSSARPSGQASAYWCIDSTGKRCGVAGQPADGATVCGACATQN